MKKFKQLKAEAIKRGVWNNPNTRPLKNSSRPTIFYELYNPAADRLCDNFGVVYEKGKWIEPLTTSTKPTHYQTQNGIKENEGKLNIEYDWRFLKAQMDRMAKNKDKYPKYNWKKPIDIEGLKDALFRHVLEVMDNNFQDGNEVHGHLTAISLNAMMIFNQLNNEQNQ